MPEVSPRRRSVAAVALLAATGALSACGGGGDSSTTAAERRSDPAPRQAATSAALLPETPLAGPTSAWRLDVSKAPAATDSAALVSSLARQVTSRFGGVAAFNHERYTVAFYSVGKRTPRQDVVFDDCQGTGLAEPPVLYAGAGAPFRSVPIPAKAKESSGSDGELSIYSPSTDQLWDLWQARKVGDRWHACYGGRIDDFSTNPGYFPNLTGASASGTTIEAGTLGLRETRAGRVDHALVLAIPEVAAYPAVSYPAQRTDGVVPAGTPGAIALGTRFRLDLDLDVDSLGLTPIATVIAKAAQRYGFIVTDTSGSVAVSGERGRSAGAWDSLMRGVPDYLIMRDFPWDRMQALPRDYGKP